MTKRLGALAFAIFGFLAACSTQSPLTNTGPLTNTAPPETPGPLFEELATLDAEVFGAFNSCALPGQLQKHAEYFSEDVEFYHDTGGVTWSRKEMLANTEKYVCGNFRRELVAGSLRVYPIKDYGAIARGVHRFCQFESAACEGAAEFVIVWRREGSTWRITRVLSYGHRSI
jgi:hypothetical protein